MSLSTVPTDPTLVGIYVAGSDEPTRDFFGERAAWVSLSGPNFCENLRILPPSVIESA